MADVVYIRCILIKLGWYQAARNGRGDRADPSKWTEVKGPLEVSSASNFQVYSPRNFDAVGLKISDIVHELH